MHKTHHPSHPSIGTMATRWPSLCGMQPGSARERARGMPLPRMRSGPAPSDSPAGLVEVVHLEEEVMMPRRIGSTQILTLFMVLLVALAGCSNMPTAPQAPSGSSAGATGGSSSQVLGLSLLG